MDIPSVDWVSAEMASPVQSQAFKNFIEKYAALGYAIQYKPLIAPDGRLIATALVYRVKNDDTGYFTENEEDTE